MAANIKKPDGKAKKNKAGQQPTPSEKIKAAFHKLNPAYDIDTSALNEILFMSISPSNRNTPSEAERYLHMRRRGGIPAMPWPKHRNSWQECSLNTAEKELTNIQRATKKLQKAFNAMHETTIYALVHVGVRVEIFEEFLNATTGETDKAKEFIGRLKKDYPEWVSKKSGQPKKETSFRIAEILADEYHRATQGKKPTVSFREVRIHSDLDGGESYGNFLELVKSVFDTLDITASPDARSRKAMGLWERRNYGFYVHSAILNKFRVDIGSLPEGTEFKKVENLTNNKTVVYQKFLQQVASTFHGMAIKKSTKTINKEAAILWRERMAAHREKSPSKKSD